MRRILLLGIMMGVLLTESISVHAQMRQIADVKVDLKKITFNPTTMNVEMDLMITNLKLKSNKALVLQPVFRSNSKEMALPSVVLVGRNRGIAIERLQYKYQNEIEVYEPYVLIKKKRHSEYDVDYTVSVPVKNWVRNSELLIRQTLLCCRNKPCGLPEYSSIYTIKPIVPQFSMLDYPYNKVDSMRFAIYFENNKSNLNLNYKNNGEAIRKICESIGANDYVKIDLVGSASPIGNKQLNAELSRNRSKVVFNYLTNNCKIDPKKISFKWIGEDWNGLIQELKASDNQNLRKLATMLDVKVDDNTKRQILQNKLDKTQLNYVKNILYSYLRKTTVLLVNNMSSYNIANGIKQMNIAPQNMSEQEMLKVASSYDVNSPQYLKALQTILKYYPENEVALVNISSIYLKSSDLKMAKEYLDKIEKNPVSWNNLGIYYLMSENGSYAYDYFKKAAESGNKQAEYNLDKLFNNVVK